MFLIGEFIATREAEVVPLKWLASARPSLKDTSDCWWPPYKSRERVNQSIIKKESVNEETWTTYKYRVLGKYDSYEKARRKLSTALDTSNLESEEEASVRKRKKPERLFFSSSDEEVNTEDDLPSPPTPPVLQKKVKEFPVEVIVENKENHGELAKLCTETDFKAFCHEVRRGFAEIRCKLNLILEQQRDLNYKISLREDINDSVEEERVVEDSIWNRFPLDEGGITALEVELEKRSTRETLQSRLQKIGGSGLKGVTLNLLRKLFKDEEAVLFSWVGGKKKKVFSTLKITTIILDVVRKHIPDATDGDISTIIKVWLRNAKTRMSVVKEV